MQVTVQFFARLRELADRREWTCDVGGDATVADVWRMATEAFPGLSVMTGSVSCAVNADFARMDTRIGAGDEIAFLPPVSGGHGNDQR